MKIVALAGGVGGAKLAYGLAHSVDPEDLAIIVNTGDDFYHYGLYICPDLDTVCYTIAGLVDPQTGWGRKDDFFQSLEESIKLGGPNWFKMGNKDLGTHLERTRRLQTGEKLSAITQSFCNAWGVKQKIYPMTNDQVATILNTYELGEIPFQEYFVHQQCKPTIRAINFSGIQKAKPSPGVIESVERADLVIICPSNPWVSIDPILSIKEIKRAMISKKVIAVSPIVQKKALKGPAAKMFSEFGIEPSAASVAAHYRGLIRGFIFDNLDASEIEQISRWGIICYTTDTIMRDNSDKVRLAKEIINFSKKL